MQRFTMYVGNQIVYDTCEIICLCRQLMKDLCGALAVAVGLGLSS